MEQDQNFKLIDGIFIAEEAEKVLTTLLNYKIDYHNREDFSNHIRFNQSIENSKKRIQELNSTKDDIKKMIQESKKEGYNLIINSNITIRLEK
ncbi:hypothetical protein ACNQGB_00395 [Flavobacterium sp. XS1P32]|uniref:hypothetical protein n=1 Tax=Flavobacterium sp. XS1P32 TaxID=3401726 RepID=UPI003AAB86DF